ncbi:hypothetical protein DL95DRAFT_436295 [Leptodontidium sp. 2 PMI_412]|nr:hypothetical protein DL95DRAFT_436295 [Leptodontidium sp. 2 PMI_412]
MKHSASPDLESGREKAFRRQDPVSCLFCRRKKLKCDRGAPCSNCKARKLTCSSAIDGSSIQSRPSADQPSPGASLNIDELNARVRRLEELLTRKNSFDLSASQPKSQPTSALAYSKREGPSDDIELTRAVSWIETDAFEHTPSTADEISTLDVKVTESFGSFVFSLTRPRMASKFKQNIATLLPTRSQGEVILEYYLEYVDWIHHVIHAPTVRERFDSLYTNIEMGLPPNYAHLALISTLFALSAYFSTATSGLYFKPSESMIYSRRWTLLAQEALSATNCLAEPSIETLQSLILISQHMMANIGAIAMLRTLSTTIMHTARTMSLHTLDTARNKRLRENTTVDYVDLEVKRRIWWHIVSTDWLLSFMSGAQCGTYMIHPKQMNVDYPSNVDDDHIIPLGPASYAQPPSVPTEMTYHIFRLRFSAVFREMVDAAWETGSDMDDLPYEIVLELDKKLSAIAADFDNSYSALTKNVPNNARPGSPRVDGKIPDAKRMRLIRQRNLAQFGMHTRLARLHRPYLVRGAQDPRYSYSRMVCLRSARTVIELGKMMAESSKEISYIKMWFVNHHVFVSTVILVMDYCFNREEPRARERREEILECFRLLEGSRNESTIASRGLAKLKSMLGEKSGEARGMGREGVDNASRQRPPPPPTPAVSNSQQQSQPYHPTSSSSTSSNFNILQPPPEQLQFPTAPTYQTPYTDIDDFSTASNPSISHTGLQNAWSEFDSLSFDNINFDVDLDASQFEVLFQGIDATAYS